MKFQRTLTVLTILWINALLSFTLNAQDFAVRLSITDGVDDPALKWQMEANASLVLTTLNESALIGKLLKLPASAITEDGRKSIQAKWATSARYCPQSTIREKGLLRVTGTYQIRNIPMKIWEDNDEEQQYWIFNFTKDGKIDEVLVPYIQINPIDFIAESANVEEERNIKIIEEFLERFRTYYEEKKISELDKVFSDNALIITGKEIKTGYYSEQSKKFVETKKIEYRTQTKKEYLDRLKSVFTANKWIKVQFNLIDIHKHPKYDDMYGVVVEQGWSSSTGYKDVGYLFLLVDFRNKSYPIVQVRTWEPKSNEELLPESEKLNASYYNLDSPNY